tara:strand:+ start:227 stop:1633 length:1407 start_codon:yes stop_codon:yes gene_type:complete
MSAVIPNPLVLKEENRPLPQILQRRKYESSEGVVSGGSIAKIFIPSGRNQFINGKNSWLNFTVVGNLEGTNLPDATGLNTYDMRLDPMGLTQCIRKITVRNGAGGNTVYELDNYAKAVSMLTVSEANATTSNVRALTSNNAYLLSGQFASLIGNPLYRIGPLRTDQKSDGTELETGSYSASIPLLGLLGNCNIPICEITSGLEISIEFERDVFQVFYVGAADQTAGKTTLTGGTMSFSEISYEGSVTTLDDASMKEVASANNFKSSPVMWSDSYHILHNRTFTSDELETEQDVNVIVPSLRFTSLNAIYHACYQMKQPSNLASYPLGVPHIGINKIRYRIGGIEHPRNYVDSLPRMVQNTMGCFTNVNQSSVSGLMSSSDTTLNYRPPVDANPDATLLFTDRGVVGVNFECFPDIDSIAGLDTTNVDCECQFGLSGDDANDQNLDFWWLGCLDVVYVLEDGNLRRSFN